MSLVLEVEYLSGVVFAAVTPDSTAPDWPPQPDRVFSALVATWGLADRSPQGAEALEWLERLPPPRMQATDAAWRTAATHWVPPNDPSVERQKNAKGVLPAMRARQPRRFPAAVPESRVVRFIWADAVPDAATLEALGRLAHCTSFIGHSASLTRCHFCVDSDLEVDPGNSAWPRRRIYEGRFDELRREYERGRYPGPGAPCVQPTSRPQIATSVFSDRWLLLEHVAGVMPDVRACAYVSRTLRDAVMSGYERTGLGDAVPEVVSGHSAGGTPSRDAHLSIVPLPFVGFPYADGHVMGYALIPPRDADLLGEPDFKAALRALAPIDERTGRRVITVRPKAEASEVGAFSIELSPTVEPSRRSLEPALYLGPSRTFATVTPIVLDRHLKSKGSERDDEVAAQIAGACGYIGLPAPSEVVTGKYSAFEGAVPAYPAGRAPRWMRWNLPAFLANRQLVHAVIQFDEAVAGPVILGAGRYAGLGLCRPL